MDFEVDFSWCCKGTFYVHNIHPGCFCHGRCCFRKCHALCRNESGHIRCCGSGCSNLIQCFLDIRLRCFHNNRPIRFLDSDRFVRGLVRQDKDAALCYHIPAGCKGDGCPVHRILCIFRDDDSILVINHLSGIFLRSFHVCDFPHLRKCRICFCLCQFLCWTESFVCQLEQFHCNRRFHLLLVGDGCCIGTRDVLYWLESQCLHCGISRKLTVCRCIRTEFCSHFRKKLVRIMQAGSGFSLHGCRYL